MGVSTIPGETALTVIPSRAHSRARCRLRPEHPGLGGRVMDAAERAGRPAGHRRHVDDAAVARVAQGRVGRAGTQERPRQVGIDHEVPLLGADLGRCRRAQDARVVDQDVDPAEAVRGRRHEGRDVVRPGDVDMDRQRLAPGRLDRGDRLARRRVVQIGDHHRRAVGGEPFRDRAADAASGPGHDRHPTIETPIGHGHPPHPVLPALTWLARPPNASEGSVS